MPQLLSEWGFCTHTLYRLGPNSAHKSTPLSVRFDTRFRLDLLILSPPRGEKPPKYRYFDKIFNVTRALSYAHTLGLPRLKFGLFCLFVYLFINPQPHTISQQKHNLKKIKQRCGLNGQDWAVPLTCSQNVS